MDKIKVLFVMEKLSAGGAEKALINLLHHIDYDRYDVDLQLFFNTGINLKYLPDSVNLLPPLVADKLIINKEKALKDLKDLRFWYLIKKLWFRLLSDLFCKSGVRQKNIMRWKCEISDLKKINKKVYDVAIGYIQDYPTFYVHDCVTAKRKICWFHNEYSKRLRCDMDEKYFSGFDSVVTISPICVEAMRNFFPNLTNIRLLYNLNCPWLINTLADEYYPEEFKGEEGRVKLLTIGRLHYQKGVDMAIDAAAILKKRGVSFRWYVLGTGNIKADIEERIKENGLLEDFILLGVRDNPYVYIKNADIIVQTSRYEGKSVVIDEAKILKKPIVCTNYNSVADQLKDGQSAIITPIEPEGIAKGIQDMINDEALRNKIVNYLAEHIEDEQEKLNAHYRVFDIKGSCASQNVIMLKISNLIERTFLRYIVPDSVFLRICYRARMGKKLNLKNPQTLNEKMQWLKIHYRKPEHIKLVDKYEVREYIAEEIGSEYSVPLIGVWDKFDDIDFSALPRQFVLKCTHDSGGNIICKDKSELDIKAVRKKFNRSMRINYFWHGREWQYKYVKPRIIAEQYMEDKKTGELADYKILCFNGEPKVTYVCTGRQVRNGFRVTCYDNDWNVLPFEWHSPAHKIPPGRPENFDTMLSVAKKIAKDMPFVRIDFYEADGRAYLGEITFFPGAGNYDLNPPEWDYILGSWINLPDED